MPTLSDVAKSNPFNRPQANSGDGLVEFGSVSSEKTTGFRCYVINVLNFFLIALAQWDIEIMC